MGRSSRGQYLIYIAVFIICLLIYLQFIETRESFQGHAGSQPKGIIIDMMCGLGNQLYIYSAGKMFQRTWNVPIYLKLSPGLAFMHTTVDYRPILFSDFEAVEINHPMFEDVVDAEVQAKSPIHRFWDPWSAQNIPKTDKYVFLQTQWYQDYSSIEPVIPEVRRKILGIMRERYPEASVDEGSAFMHVRRGDYTKQENTDYLLGNEYYRAALEKLNAHAAIKTINIFSDDIGWCKQQQWDSPKQIKYIDEPDEIKALYLMSLCNEGASISNSTYSTWGAILGASSKGSPVIYPAKWLYGADTSFPSSWIRI